MANSSQPLVSIVTPAYNEEKYLAECVESVRGQTYENWEYTIVDNCSTDQTSAIACQYAKKDPRIRVVRNEALLPALVNFNAALRGISRESKYTKMVLADDWIFPDCLERMVAVMEAHPTIGIVGAYGLVSPWIMWTGLPYPSNFVSGPEVCRMRLLGGPYVFGSQTSVLYRSEMVRSRDPFFNESNMQADSEVCFELLKTWDFGFVHQVLTFSRDERPDSLLQASRRLNTAAAGFLHELVAYGPIYLSSKELQTCIARSVSKYYEFLAASVFQKQPDGFWEFHKQKLKEEGMPLEYGRLASTIAKKILHRFTRVSGSEERQWGL